MLTLEIFDPKNVGTRKFVDPQKNWPLNNILTNNIFSLTTNFDPRQILTPKFVDPQQILTLGKKYLHPEMFYL